MKKYNVRELSEIWKVLIDESSTEQEKQVLILVYRLLEVKLITLEANAEVTV